MTYIIYKKYVYGEHKDFLKGELQQSQYTVQQNLSKMTTVLGSHFSKNSQPPRPQIALKHCNLPL